jgi:hypothetical protein
MERSTRLSEISAALAERMPIVVDAAIALLASIPPAPIQRVPSATQGTHLAARLSYPNGVPVLA